MPARGVVFLFPCSPSSPSSPPFCDTAVLEVWCRSPGATERAGITSSGHKDPSSFLPTAHLSSKNIWTGPAVPMLDQPRVACPLFFPGIPQIRMFCRVF